MSLPPVSPTAIDPKRTEPQPTVYLCTDKPTIKTAILIDGGFYLRAAEKRWGKKSAADRANELMQYCRLHLQDPTENRFLYRIFYYDCPPSERELQHPFTKKQVKLKDSPLSKWMTFFHNELRDKRKVALRFGRLSDSQAKYILKPDVVDELLKKTKTVNQITEQDFVLSSIEQKGVDARIGLDVASIAYKKQVDQIILISGDSDFIPVVKHARREGIEVILDPMGLNIKPELREHLDGVCTPQYQSNPAQGSTQAAPQGTP